MCANIYNNKTQNPNFLNYGQLFYCKIRSGIHITINGIIMYLKGALYEQAVKTIILKYESI